MTLSLAAKKAVVEEVTAVASKAVSAVVADYRGLTVNQMTQLRTEARKAEVYLRVVKNTLTRRSLENTSFSCLDEHLVGPLFIAFSMNAPSDAARLLKDFAKSNDKLEVKALSVGGQYYPASQIDAVASLPTKDEALSKFMYVSKAPVEKMARIFAAVPTKLVRTLVAIKESKTA